jgi:eukaryotic-like serine/threonine-protein kinase
VESNQGLGVGATVDRYQIVRKIGEGGFGEVFEAEQLEPVQRRVALKLILQGMNTKEVIARFDAERQALAMMEHPNIAKVFDAGATSSGQPFFVMELVDGVPINQYCDVHKLSIPARLRLIAQACAAIQHAHGKGIVHRDLKPGNILVCDVHGEMTVKVIDFGVAKAISGRLTDLSLVTKVHQVVGTLQYMSPEQINGSLDIDTRTDVYALGAVLYEVLTGKTPLAFEETGGVLIELQRMIRDIEPIRPSSRISDTQASLNTRAAQCSSSPGKLKDLMRGELDWVVMKALDKERAKRYETTSALAADLQRYLDGQSVLAVPPSQWYRFRKLVRRNKLVFGAAASVFLVLAVGVAGFAWQARIANTRAFELAQVVEFQASMLVQIDPAVIGNQLTHLAKKSLTQTLRVRNATEAEFELKSKEFESIWQVINATDTARELISKALLEPSARAIDKDFAHQPIVQATLRQSLADRYFEMGVFDRALALAESALKLRQKHLGSTHVNTLRSHVGLCNLVSSLGDLEKAKTHCEIVLNQMPKADGRSDEDLMASLNAAAGFAYAQNDMPTAVRLGTQSLELGRKQGNDAAETIELISTLGIYYLAMGKFDQAKPLLRESVERSTRVLGDEHSATLVAYNSLGTLLDSQGKVEEAEAIYRKSLTLHRKARGEDNPDTLHAARNLALVLFNRGKTDEAEPLWRFALERRRQRLSDEHPDSVNSFGDMAALLIAKEAYEEALPFALEAHDKYLKQFGEDHPAVINARHKLSACLRPLGRLQEAKSYAELAVTGSVKLFDPSHPFVLMTKTELASVLLAQQRNQEVLDLLSTIIEPARKTFSGAKAYRSATLLHVLGKANMRLGRFKQAESYLLEAQQLFVAAPSPARTNLRDCLKQLVDLYRRWNAAEPNRKYVALAAQWQVTLAALEK